MAKYELVKETSWNGSIMWYTRKDEMYETGTIAHDEEEARRIFEKFVERDNVAPKIEVLKTITK